VDFSTRDLADQIQKQKDLQSYDAPGFDPTVLRELKSRVDAAVKMEQELATKIKDSHAAAKRDIDLLTALIKKKGKELSQAELAGVDRMVANIAKASAAADKEAVDAKNPLLPWRAAWETEWRKLLSDPKKLDPYLAQRKPLLDAAPGLTAMRDRMKEYVKRSQDMQKAAKQLVTKVNQSAGGEAKEIADFVKQTGEYTKMCSEASTKGTGLLLATWLKAGGKTKKPTPDDIDGAEDMLARTEVFAKSIRGALKSYEIKMAAFKKSAARFNGQNKKNAATAYGTAAKGLKSAQAGAKTLASNQAKAAKIVADWKKSAAKKK
jgi:hypothetical protein